ncbi:hypothetical protein F4553_002902 [Allocatelliglobosispora scoriae]|uniref:Calcineurin-like phosphoesterase domain-containing protein n=1 Tax=Allocatelliglobosispora scoriae TaxID=643052 RepID=A0A841BRI0_9ACTN|nr:metallophosphoesterase [Allocatelliglobosispora scoriae]MBB5869523.1 hypothetical protein [Allocatelliglobosispora scoriae]
MALYVVGDVHGHLVQLTDALQEAGLIGDSGGWVGGTDKLWFLGDLTDRGPDGIGVIDLIRGLQPQAAAAGGEVGCVIGNHDLLLYGAKLVPNAPVSEVRSVVQVWALNGGQDSDLVGLTPDRQDWIAALPAVALIDDHLLIHADTTGYLEFGDSIAEINAYVRGFVAHPDPATFGIQTRVLFRRFEFLDAKRGITNVKAMLAALGGSRIVHGHSTIPETFGVAPNDVDGPVVYAGGLAVAADTGIALGSACVPVKLT